MWTCNCGIEHVSNFCLVCKDAEPWMPTAAEAALMRGVKKLMDMGLRPKYSEEITPEERK